MSKHTKFASRTSKALNLELDLVSLARVFFVDVGLDSCSVDYVFHRVKHEGISFLTVTLPKLSKALLESLELGYFVRPTNFSWKGSSLLFCNSLLTAIFDRHGVLLSAPSIEAIADLRQICDYFYKLAFDFSSASLEKAEREYIATDASVHTVGTYDYDFVDRMRSNFEHHYRASKLSYDKLVSKPRNGPGSFAKHSHVSKSPYYLEKLQTTGSTTRQYKAFDGRFKAYPSSKTRVALLSDEKKQCEVLFVPKDSRGPRTIAREPHFNLMVQMSFFDRFSASLQNCTNGRIQFTDQSIFRTLSQKASVDRLMTTIDLKEGSDRISNAISRHVLRSTPIPKLFNLARSTHAKLPSGKTVKLNKLASMGSGFTFPIMALQIHLSICTNVSRRLNLSYKDVMSCVYVYGDDIIVPTRWYDLAVEGLNIVGLMVNSTKSFRHSAFRESCGGDYYNGVDVTPVRLKLTNANLPSPVSTIELGDQGIAQLESHCRVLKQHGFWETAEYIYNRIESVLGPLPLVTGSSPILGRYVFCEDLILVKDVKVKCWVTRSRSISAHGVSEEVFLGQVLRTSQGSSPIWFHNIEPERDFTMVDVPRDLSLRKRLVYDTCYLGR